MASTEELYTDYLNEQNPELRKSKLEQVVNQFTPAIERRAKEFAGNVNPQVAIGKGYAITARAIETFNPAENAALSTHVLNSLMKLNRLNYEIQPVRPPEAKAIKINRLLAVKRRFTLANSKEPTYEDLAQETGYPVNEIKDLLTVTTKNIGEEEGLPDETILSSHNLSEVLRDYPFHQEIFKHLVDIHPATAGKGLTQKELTKYIIDPQTGLPITESSLSKRKNEITKIIQDYTKKKGYSFA